MQQPKVKKQLNIFLLQYIILMYGIFFTCNTVVPGSTRTFFSSMNTSSLDGGALEYGRYCPDVTTKRIQGTVLCSVVRNMVNL